MNPPSPRRPPIAQRGMPRGPPPPGLYHPGGYPDPRYRSRPPPQYHAHAPSTTETIQSLYEDDTAESESWPLPPRPVGQSSSRSNSPSGNGPRRPPPPRPQQRQEYQHQAPEYYRPGNRMRPPNAPPQSRPPPPMSYHANPQWNGEAYGASHAPIPPSFSHRMPLPRSAQPPPPNQRFPYAPQGVYHEQQTPRPRPTNQMGRGAPPTNQQPFRPYPEAGSSGVPHANAFAAANLLTPDDASENMPVKFPSYYFEGGDNPTNPASVATSVDGLDDTHDSPMESQTGSDRGGESRTEERGDPSPEPAPLIRQASLGKKTRPTLMTVTAGERRRGSSNDDGAPPLSFSQILPAPRELDTPGVEEEVANLPGAWISEGPTPNEHGATDEDVEEGGEDATDAAATADAVAVDRELDDDDGESETASKDENASEDENASQAEDTPENAKHWFRRSSQLLSLPPGLGDFTASGSDGELHEASTETPRAATPSDDEDPFPLTTSMDSDRTSIGKDIPLNVIDVEKPPSSEHLPATEESEKRLTNPPSDMETAMSPAPARQDDTEVRGSMTSLPDLIRRATKLASNLDRGRTASRLGMDFFLASDNDTDGLNGGGEKSSRPKNRRSGASISDLLTAFPRPGSRNDDLRKSAGDFSTRSGLSRVPSEIGAAEIRGKRKKRICGMSAWAFWLVIALLVFLVAAAIVIPVVLFLVPKTSSPASPSTSSNAVTPALQKCQSQLSCKNGGVNIVSGGTSGQDGTSCSCLCVNSYTGQTCTTKSTSGCTTMTVGTTEDVTVGQDVSRLLSSADGDFNIPLNADDLLGLFSQANLDCQAENKLVAFDSTAAAKLRRARNAPAPAAEFKMEHVVAHLGTRKGHRARKSSSSTTVPSTSSSSVAASTTSSSTSAAASASASSTGSAQDFAGIAVLYILQASGSLDTATSAQQTLASYFTQSGQQQEDSAKNVSLGAGFSCDLSQQTLMWSLPNGTVVSN